MARASSWHEKCMSSRSILRRPGVRAAAIAPARRSDGRRPPPAIRPTAHNSPDSPPPAPSSAFAGAGTAAPNDVEFKARASEHFQGCRAHGAQEPSRGLVRRTHPIPPPLFVEQRRADAIPLIPAHRRPSPASAKTQPGPHATRQESARCTGCTRMLPLMLCAPPAAPIHPCMPFVPPSALGRVGARCLTFPCLAGRAALEPFGCCL